MQDWGYTQKPDINAVKSQLDNRLNEIDFSNLDQYQGYHIGVASEAKSDTPGGGKISKVNYYVFILPANPQITPSTYKPV